MILAIETSCDDTCAAVVTADGEIRSNVISSQGIHDRFGGVVPEIASRHHLELIGAVVDDALAQGGDALTDVELVAVTRGPGLVAALLVGLATRQGAGRRSRAAAGRRSITSTATSRPASWTAPGARAAVRQPDRQRRAHVPGARGRPRPRTTEVLGQTLDDAAGEAFDKGARLLGLGYPGGPALERLARDGDPEAFAFPTARTACSGLDFSFAGLKTALLYKVRELGRRPRPSAGGPTWPPPTSTRSSRRCRSGSSGRLTQTGLDAAGGRRRRGRQRPAARAAGRRSASSSTSRRASCAPTTRR